MIAFARTREIALPFLRLGVTAFGGPAAHIAMMRAEFVERRRWLTDSEFLDLLGAASLLPGPSSTQVAIFIGQLRGGAIGLLIAGACFILPAALIATVIAWMYVASGSVPAASGVFVGIKAAVVAIVVQALITFARTAVKTIWLGIAGAIALVAGVAGAAPVVVLLGAGTFESVRRSSLRGPSPPRHSSSMAFAPPLLTAASQLPASAGLGKVLTVFLKFGSVVFGSGYVLVAFLRADLVDRLHWLTESQLIDAVAVGQVTPGPVFTTATFIGYLVAGVPGAVVATVGIFLPSFALVALSGRFVAKARQSQTVAAFLDGVNVASLALMAIVTVQLGRSAIVDLPTTLLTVAGVLILLRWRPNPAIVVLAGAICGALLERFG